MRRWLLLTIATTSLLAVPSAQAFPCAPGANPFTDVPDSIFYCTNTLWLSNANVTLGCGGNLYCPDADVPRSQMALFMNRLAKALTPEIMVDTGGPPQGDLDTQAFTCRSPGLVTVPPGNRRILSSVHAILSLQTNADADIGLTLLMSVNGGSFVSISTPTMAVHVPANKWTMASVIGGTRIQLGAGSLELGPGDTVEFQVSMNRLPGTTTGEVTSTRCQLKFDMPMHWNQN